MTDESTFMTQILAHPHDVDIRLVFADWLEEHNQADRAEFIRLDIERTARIERFGEGIRASHQNRNLDDRLKRLHDPALDEWLASQMMAPWECIQGEYRNGFLESVATDLEVFLHIADQVVGKIPLTGLHLTKGNGYLESLTDHPILKRLTSLDLQDVIWDHQDLAHLRTSSRTDQLKNLRLDNTRFDCDIFEWFFGGDEFARILRLGLSNNYLHPEGLQLFLADWHLTGLRRLNLASNILGDAGLELLATAPMLEQLTHLDLSNNNASSAGIQQLAQSPYAKQLRVLQLSGNPIGDEGIIALIQSPYIRKLQMLTLVDTNIGEAGMNALLASKRLSKLEFLHLSSNGLPDALITRLKESLGDRLTLEA